MLPNKSPVEMRQDIQFLRGFAVLAVVFYHASVFPIKGGFLGVDIFFVISGFLITSIILRDLDIGRFSFRRFYVRRAKRLLPAAYFTLILTSLAGYIILSKQQWSDYIFQLLGTVTFSNNMVLPFQTGYFQKAAEAKPLLHTWSLSLEEQYYLFIPLFLYIVTNKLRGWLLTAASLLSLVFCLFFVSFPLTWWRLPTINTETIAFYSLPTRAWELLVGSQLAWLSRRAMELSIAPIFKFTAFLALVFCVFFPLDSLHPRGDAFIVVIATSLLLMGNDDWLPLNVVTRALSKIGDWSYSLYLVHWPLFAFAHIVFLGAVPVQGKYLLVASSLFLAYLQYQFVEQRFRFGWHANSRRTFQWLVAATVMVFIVPMPAIIIGLLDASSGYDDFDNSNPRFLGLSSVCTDGNVFPMPPQCMTSKQPIVAVWGDSYAMHLMPGLIADAQMGKSLVQITKAACAPIMGVASIDANYNESWAKGCLEFNVKALEYIKNNKSIKYVIMSSPFSGYFDYGELTLFYKGRTVKGTRDIAISQMISTIDALQRSGKQPIIITPPPKAGFDIGECWARKGAGLLVMNRSDCNFTVSTYQSFQKGVIDSLRKIEHSTNVKMVWLDRFICKGATCLTKINNDSIYRDGGHLTVAGAEYIVPQLDIIR